MTRNDLLEKIMAAKQELPKAGVIHRRDLHKHIKRMEKELRDYDMFHAMARG